jgi:phosphoserine phosphatase
VDDPPGRHALTADRGPLVPDGLDATLVLVRHGESTFIAEGRFQGQADAPLTPLGLRQAGLVADRLAAPHASPALPVPTGQALELVHSPLGRTAQTAAAIEDALARAGSGPARRPDAGFLEIHQGDWQGLHRDEIIERYATQLAGWRRTPLEAWATGGESLRQVEARVRPALAELLTRLAAAGQPGSHDRPQVAGYGDPRPTHPWTIVVGHDWVFKVALLTVFDLPLERFWMWSMDLCAITVVELRAGRPVLRAHNLTGHLADLANAEAVEALDERASGGAL